MRWGEAATVVRSWQWTLPALALIAGVMAVFVQVGADWDWLVALGHHIRRAGAVPRGVPFAAADSDEWHNVLVLAEVVASLLQDASPWSVGLLHLIVASLGLTTLAAAARRSGASDRLVAGALLVVLVGALPAIAVVRAQTWSLLFFPLLLALVVTQARRPDRRIWWAPPLLALWGNLHGAVLLGVCVLGAYLIFDRLRGRPSETVAVGAVSLLALCLTPQLWNTPAYYVGVLTNVSASRGVGLWARPSVHEPLDLALMGAAALLLVAVLRRRRRIWEYVALLGLLVSTASAARHGVWLLCLLVVLLPAARGQMERAHRLGTGHESGLGWMVATFVMVVIVTPIALLRGDVHKSDERVISAVVRTAEDGVVLAPAPMVEALAVRGVTIWAGNPLDAFAPEIQAAYLDFLSGDPGMARAVTESDVVVAMTQSRTAKILASAREFDPVPCGPGWTCFLRR